MTAFEVAMLREGSLFRRVCVVALCALILQGCALYDAFSEKEGEISSGDVSVVDDVGVDVDLDANGSSGKDVTSVENIETGVGDDTGEQDLDVLDNGDVSDTSGPVCSSKCIGGCSANNKDDCNEVVVSIATGHYHACALSNNSMVYCWGSNSHGQLGRNIEDSTDSFDRAVLVEGLNNVKSIVAGENHTCAVRYNNGTQANEVWCWGDNEYGQITGDKYKEEEPGVFVKPKLVSSLSDNVKVKEIKSISAGSNYTCAHVVSSRPGEEDGVACWGYWSNGIYVHHGVDGKKEFEPVYIGLDAGGNDNVLIVPSKMSSSQYGHICVIGSANAVVQGKTSYGEAVWCWGEDYYLQQDLERVCILDESDNYIGDLSSRGLEFDISGDSIVSTGSTHTCFMKGSADTDKVQCWGLMFSATESGNSINGCEYKGIGLSYQESERGRAGTAAESKKVCELSFDDNVVDVISGDGIACVQLKKGKVECRGADVKGEGFILQFCSNYYAREEDEILLDKVELNSQGQHDIKQFSLGSSFACALLGNSSVRCWGDNAIVGAGDSISHWATWSDEQMFEIKFN